MEDSFNDNEMDHSAMEKKMKMMKARRLAIEKNLKDSRNRGKQNNQSQRPLPVSELSDICSKQTLDIDTLKNENANLQFELRKANYELRKALEREHAAKEGERLESVRNRTLANNTHKSLENLETRVKMRETALFEDCGKILNMVNALERHSMRGIHAVSSATGTGLILKIKQGVQAMRNTVHYSNDMTDNIKSAAEETDKADTLDNTLLEMCQHLENENATISRTLEELNNELEEAKKGAAAAPLIRHYRLAIVRSRAEAERLKDKLAEERELSQSLRLELERNMQDLAELAGDHGMDKANTREELKSVDKEIDELKSMLKRTALSQTSEVVSSAFG